MRTKKAIINMITGVLGKFSNVILQFVSRTIFINILGSTYLGVYGLFSEVLMVLSLAELGIGTAIVFNLYKPIAENDEPKMKALMNLYGKVYKAVGAFILIVGILCTPLIPLMDRKSNIPDLMIIYVLYVISSASSYLFVYKSAFLVANQKEYIYTTIRVVFNFIQVAAQLAVLAITKSFIFYLVAQILVDLIKNIYVSYKVERMYPFLKNLKGHTLPKEHISNIWKDVKALIIYKFSNVMVNSTDNILITMFVGIVQTGLYSNYSTILTHVVHIIDTIVYSFDAGIGNYNATESDENKYKMFKNFNFFMNWIFGFSVICLFVLFNPFIHLWIGDSYLFTWPIVAVICLNFYVTGTQKIIWSFRQAMGLFVYGKYKPLVSVVVNLVSSVILAKQYGLIGVFIGTSITRIFVDIWFDPYIVHKYGFKLSVINYYLDYIRTVAVIIVAALATLFASQIFNGDGFLIFGWKFLCCISIPNVIFWICYHKRDEMGYLKMKCNNIIQKIKK
ncbi:lipopolysaccharide biosynthesis protein [Anaerosacchariphilus polymeriproducens]|uniref:Sugar translocase n=1 Tax=Anaerosacchariphilus polymeriproducens TaxID=1812858 RepID=A0A371AZ09_9FIRM|nr:oligosaccharide flippase family protein [Anaerosacchariphilus polymeriproducens]RDU24783.1 sugar translocase [Anaerosacchariphilus polymeriproducens]